MKFHCIAAYRHQFRVASLCRVLGVSRSGYYAWAARLAPRQAARNAALLVHIRAASVRGRRTYGAPRGAPRVHQELRAQGLRCGRHRVARLMRREAIVACTERRFRCTATARAELPAAPDRLQRDCQADAPDRRGVSDLTSLPTGQGWRHLAIGLDLGSRRIVGWAMHATLTPALVAEALTEEALTEEALPMALAARQPAPGLLVHTEGGGQYRATSVRQLVAAPALVPSTSRPGRCLDNAAASTMPLPRQCGGRELLPHAQDRARRPAPLREA